MKKIPIEVAEIKKAMVNEVAPEEYPRTCTLTHPQRGKVCMVRNVDYFETYRRNLRWLHLILPNELRGEEGYGGLSRFFTDMPDWYFAVYHNWVTRDKGPLKNVIDAHANIHPSAVIGTKSMRIIEHPETKARLWLHHVGNVVIEKGADIGANSVVHRGNIDSTIIEGGAVIGSLANIGHNCRVGRRTIIGTGTIMGGSSSIGKNCFVACGVIFVPGVTVCDNVFIGAGAVVSKSITKPGRWVGSPCRHRGDWDGTW
jgi:acetyltransferase-like isoleucine patch superfamily enzyme